MGRKLCLLFCIEWFMLWKMYSNVCMCTDMTIAWSEFVVNLYIENKLCLQSSKKYLHGFLFEKYKWSVQKILNLWYQPIGSHRFFPPILYLWHLFITYIVILSTKLSIQYQ